MVGKSTVRLDMPQADMPQADTNSVSLEQGAPSVDLDKVFRPATAPQTGAKPAKSTKTTTSRPSRSKKQIVADENPEGEREQKGGSAESGTGKKKSSVSSTTSRKKKMEPPVEQQTDQGEELTNQERNSWKADEIAGEETGESGERETGGQHEDQTTKQLEEHASKEDKPCSTARGSATGRKKATSKPSTTSKRLGRVLDVCADDREKGEQQATEDLDINVCSEDAPKEAAGASSKQPPKRAKYVFNAFDTTGQSATNNCCHPPSNSFGSDDENVILKLNVSTPPAPMGAFSSNTALYAARIDEQDASFAQAHSMMFDSAPAHVPSDVSTSATPTGSAGRSETNNHVRSLCGVPLSPPHQQLSSTSVFGGLSASHGSQGPLGLEGSPGSAGGTHHAPQPQGLNQQGGGQLVAENRDAPAPDGNNLRSIRLLAEFEEKNKSGEWPASTSVHCYWCSHPFNGPPMGIPAKYVRDKFYLYGCFCSLECAAAYNFQHNGSIDERWRRYSLINLLAARMGHKGVVKQAPDRLALNIYGGHLDIDAFRSYCKTQHRLTLVNFPPMQTMTQQVEEINEGDVRCMRPSYIPLDHGRANRAQAKIVLKRSKPLVSGKNTLDRAMNLEYRS